MMMKKIMLVSCLATLIMACQTQPIDGHKDKHGCLTSADFTWSVLKQQCVRVFNISDIQLSETFNDTTYTIDVILSEDKQQAEVFAVNVPKNTILYAVEGGYISNNHKIRLMNTTKGWKFLVMR